MNSFREKIGLLLTDASIGEPLYKTTTTASVEGDVIELLLESNNHGSVAATLDARKKRADTAETEMSFPLQSNNTRDEFRLEDIGSYDDDECVIWYADSSLSLSHDEIDRTFQQAEPPITLNSLETASVFTVAETVLGIQSDTSSKDGTVGKHKKSNKNSSNKSKFMRRGFFSSGILLTGGRNKLDVPSRIKNNNNNNNNDDDNNNNTGSKNTQSATSSAARSRKFFSVSKVPASIAEEPCSTPSSTSASVASSP
jgi:hypothetical protein